MNILLISYVFYDEFLQRNFYKINIFANNLTNSIFIILIVKIHKVIYLKAKKFIRSFTKTMKKQLEKYYIGIKLKNTFE